jgi:uroporphyrinogen-III synthase
VGHTVAYRRVVPQWSVEQRAQALSCLEGDAVWLFSSGEGVGQLPRLLPEVCWAGARGLATHSRIADAARALGMGNVRVSRPALPDVLQALSQWRDSSGHSGVLEGHPA